MTHLLDLAGIEVVRQVRVPDASRRFGGDEGRRRWRDLAASIAIGSAIASEYRQHSVYRQVFEEREDKRRQAFSATVDAADPTGRLLGSWVVVGDFGGRTGEFAAALRDACDREGREDAPGIAVPVDVRTTVGREAYVGAVARLCRARDLRPTPEAVSLLHGLTRSVYDATDALARLASENDGREIRASELRYALGQLDPDRLLPGVAPETTGTRSRPASSTTYRLMV